MDSSWDVVISSLQDACNANEACSIDRIEDTELKGREQAKTEQVDKLVKHEENLEKTKRLIEAAALNIRGLLKIAKSGSEVEEIERKIQKKEEEMKEEESETDHSQSEHEANDKKVTESEESDVSEGEDTPRGRRAAIAGKGTGARARTSSSRSRIRGRKGKSYYRSEYNLSEPVYSGCDVAFKPKTRNSEWIQCKVTKVLGETKFEVKDPEPDERNPIGQTFRAGWKDIIKIAESNKDLEPYPIGSKVLARYPETTTFYPAVVIGAKRDGTCRLKFDGEEEVGKETLVERRLVLPYPKR